MVEIKREMGQSSPQYTQWPWMQDMQKARQVREHNAYRRRPHLNHPFYTWGASSGWEPGSNDYLYREAWCTTFRACFPELIHTDRP